MDFLVYTLQLLQCTKCSVCAMQPTYGYTARIGVFEHLKRPDLPARPWRAVDAFVGGEQSLLHLQPANLAMAGRTGRSNQHRMVRAMPPAQCRGSLHRCSSTRTAPPPAASQLLRATAVTANQPTFFLSYSICFGRQSSLLIRALATNAAGRGGAASVGGRLLLTGGVCRSEDTGFGFFDDRCFMLDSVD